MKALLLSAVAGLTIAAAAAHAQRQGGSHGAEQRQERCAKHQGQAEHPDGSGVQTELQGQHIRKGDKVVIWFSSADYDERQFPDPFRFDISRTPNDHVAFNLPSPHLCLGAQLARMEIRLLIEELLPRVKEWSVDGQVERLRSNFIGGMKHLPMTVVTR